MRLPIALLTILATTLPSTESTACCLTNRLFGRSNALYAASYTPYAAGYAPYAAGYAPTSTYVVGYAAVPSTTAALPPTLNPAPIASNGVFQAQRPAYYGNPTVYTGQPVMGNVQTSYRAPISSTLRGTVPTITTLGMGGVYQAAYGSQASPGLQVGATVPVGTPVQIYQAPAPRVGGFSRFFAPQFGTSYRTAYYRVPVTYYRPVTSVDPVTGAAVTVQQPCTSYTQQLQRTPYRGLQVAPPALTQPSAVYQASPLAGGQTAPYGQVSPYAVAPSNGIGQVGAVGTADQIPVPTPSLSPARNGQSGYTPNTTPLSGAPSSPPSIIGSPATSPMLVPNSQGDLAPVDQPTLNGVKPSESSYRENNLQSEPTQRPAPKSFWELQDANNSTAMIRTRPQPQAHQARENPFSRRTPEFTGAAPIRAPEDYSSPFRRETIGTPAAPVTRELEAPPLPPAQQINPADVTSVSSRSSVSVREAALVRERTHRPAQPKRDSTWYTIQP